MLDLKLIRENPEEVERRLRTRDDGIRLDGLIKLDEERRAIIREVEELKAKRNEGSKRIGKLLGAGQKEEAERLKGEMARLAERIKELDNRRKEVEQELKDLLVRLPNLPHPSVPVSTEKGDKVVLREYKSKPQFDFPLKSHIELGEALGILDFPRAARIAGSRFPLYRGRGALLELALVQFMFRYQAEENGYEPIFPPFLGNEESFYTASQLPKFEEDIYLCERDGLYLNPTAEVLLANLHRGEILQADELPKRYAAFTTCFRREAGAAGEEERGLIRTHQFNKVELFKFTKPEDSYAELESLIEDAEDILKELGLHYRVTLLPTCDLAQQAAKTVDLEVWLPSQGKYYEVSSCSNCEDFQARRGNIRYRPAPEAKPEFVHLLNGSGVATSRLFAAILENNQRKDGSVIVPEPLRDYVGADVLR
ncbi:MAG: serine--tRNA ligase [Candidatus Bipolaricaulia bacterium]